MTVTACSYHIKFSAIYTYYYNKQIGYS